MRNLATLLLGLVLVSGVVVAPPETVTLGDVQVVARSASGCYVGATRCERLNEIRRNHDRRNLMQYSGIQRVAKEWALELSETCWLRHNPNLAYQVSNYRWVGENVGYGPDWRTVYRAFMASPGHRANMLDPDYRRIGIGARRGCGVVWVVLVFKTPA